MKDATKYKTFDCVEFKRQAQVRTYEATQHMSAEQRRAYRRQLVEHGPLAAYWRRVQSEGRPAAKTGQQREGAE